MDVASEGHQVAIASSPADVSEKTEFMGSVTHVGSYSVTSMLCFKLEDDLIMCSAANNLSTTSLLIVSSLFHARPLLATPTAH